jgi:hypothetical protein
MIQIPKKNWTWGEIKRYLEHKKGMAIDDNTRIFYIDIAQESEYGITIHIGDYGAEITNYPNQ